MNWLFGLAILPALLCGLMCVGGMVLAAVGVRRTARRACGDESSTAGMPDDYSVTTRT